MAPRTRNTESTDNGNPVAVPARSGTSAGIPKRNSGRKGNSYAEWAGEIEDLRNNLGTAYSYENVENVGTICQGIRRTYGVLASTRDVPKGGKNGTLWLEYPSTLADDGETRVVDEAKVQEILDKYAKD